MNQTKVKNESTLTTPTIKNRESPNSIRLFGIDPNIYALTKTIAQGKAILFTKKGIDNPQSFLE